VASSVSFLLSSADPDRLHRWYVDALRPDVSDVANGYRVVGFDGFFIMIDSRDDVSAKNPEPGRYIVNFDVDDARDVAARMDQLGVEWLAPLEDREGSLFATVIDPDGNYVQIIQLSAEAKAQMAEQSA
jgi:predicted enzyme related to lactoylglutathione lyase